MEAHHQETAAQARKGIDPVCGMTVDLDHPKGGKVIYEEGPVAPRPSRDGSLCFRGRSRTGETATKRHCVNHLTHGFLYSP